MRKPPARQNQADYEVGWGRPPKRTRFQPGRSGNPKGRPRPKKNQFKILKETLEQKIPIEVRGKKRTITAFEALHRQMLNSALKGNLKAVMMLLEMYAALPEDIPTPEKRADMSVEELQDLYFKMVNKVVV
jgi:Family of unknown function (DUF5681)